MPGANVTTRYLFDHRLSHSLHLDPPLPTPPELKLTLDITYIARVVYLTPSGSAYFDRQEVARQERIDCTSTLDLLSRVPELPPGLRPSWEESISSYVREAMEGVEAGRVRAVVKVEVIRETTATTTDEGDWAEEQLVSERSKQEYYAVLMTGSSLEETTAGGCDDGSSCAVCLGEFEPSKGVVRIPRCSHVFHRDCVLEWLASHPSCPLCRSEIPGLLKIKILMVMMRIYLLMSILASISQLRR